MTTAQLYSIRDAAEADPVGALTRLREIGFDAVELYGMVEHADRYAEALERSGIPAPSAHESLVGAADLDRVLDTAERLGVGTVIEPVGIGDWTDAEDVRRIARELNAAAVLAADRGLAVGYHNHWWEFGRCGDGTGYDLLVEELDPRVVLEVDTYWVTIGRADAPALLRRLRARVGFIHVKDGPITEQPDRESQLPAGEGEMPMREILAAAPHAVRVLEFDRYRGDLFDGLAAGLRFVRDTEAVR
jgi:sugar phosphate isomerase/epimerase